MPRVARVSVPDCPYHVTHRGSRGQAVFLEPGDEARYLRLLNEYGAAHGLEVWAYCLMTNHVHLVAVGRNSDSLSKTVGLAHRVYSGRLNRERSWTGHLWGNRFFSTPLDERHLWAAARYVELNPVRAGLVRDPLDYRWSSAGANAGQRPDPVLARSRPFPGPMRDWREWLLEGLEDASVAEIRRATRTGRPCGSAEFRRLVENRLGRALEPGRRGRRSAGYGRARGVEDDPGFWPRS